MTKAGVLIPSYNEARALGGVIKELRDKKIPVFVVDDGSTDGTAAIAESNGAVVLRHDKNMGKGASLRDGFAYMLKNDFDSVLVMDGDGQHNTGDIGLFFRKMEESGADIVIGNRMTDTASMPFVRKITNKIMSYLLSKMCGQDIPDTQCGFKLINKNVLEHISLESSNFDIESEILLKAARKGFKIESVPVKTIYEREVSKIKPITDTVRFLALLIRSAGK
jgi:glycosyltransferase involved in cell wall biosynthesis